MDFNSILSRFRNVRKIKSNSYQVACPCHNDSENSLTITEKGDKILMYCHAGCNTRDILSAVGLTMADLNNGIKTKVTTWRTELEAKMGKLEAVYDYGQYMKLRFQGKKILYGMVKNDQFIKGIEGIPRTLYNMRLLKRQ